MPPDGAGGGVTAGRVAAAVAGQVRWLLWLLAAATAAATGWWAATGDPSLLRLAGWFVAVAVVGLVGSFTLHEWAHAAVLRGADGVHAVTLDVTPWRVSVRAEGSLTAARALAVAVAGPLACTLAGCVLWQVPALRAAACVHLAHALLLLPPCGDGRAVVRALAAVLQSRARPAGPAGRAAAD